MIGSVEFENQWPNDDAFVPLIDGSLIRFDKEGYLEVSQYFIINIEDYFQHEKSRFP